DALDWVLVTTEPIETAEYVLRIVDFYRVRWQIEEFFETIKTGCSFEKRQSVSAGALLNVLALTLPIAWQLHRLT
ncbi:MAG: IS4 transposase, partial [Bradymonadia bacterium]